MGIRPVLHLGVVEIRGYILDQHIGFGLAKLKEEAILAQVQGRKLQRLQPGQALVANGHAAAPVEEANHPVDQE